MYILKTKQQISYDAIKPSETSIVYLRILSQDINYKAKTVRFPNQYYRLNGGVAKLVRAQEDIIPKVQYDGLVEATINPADFSLKLDDIQRAAYMGALAIIQQNATFGTSATDWEIVEISEGDEDYNIHTSNVLQL